MPLSPANGSAVKQNPPDFSWPVNAGEARWELEIKGPDGKTQRLQTTENRMSLPFALAPGEHEWRVLPASGQRGPFRFTVSADTPRFVVPAGAQLLRTASSKPHPRFRLGRQDPATSSERQRVLAQARAYIAKDFEEPAPHRKGWTGERSVERAEAQRGARRMGRTAAGRLPVAALAWHLSGGDSAFATEGRRLLLEAASLDPAGATGVSGDNLVAAEMAWGMALLYDALHSQLSPDERRKVTTTILARTKDLREAFLDGGRMRRSPFNSHGWVAWADAAAAAALIAGDDPQADELFLQVVPGFVASMSPWGGPDGGFANGTAYGYHDVGKLIVPFDVIGAACDVDLYAKPWLKNVGRFLVYSLPPGAPAGPFGDGHEVIGTPEAALTVWALAARVRDPLLQWAASARRLEPKRVSPLLLSTLGMAAATTMPPPPNTPSASFADIDWTAMHEDLGKPGRVSVYFKSSPYGSISHGHADQNAIVLHAAGKALLKSSGYYDYYGSDHYKHWYQTTQAHNAITFDGGRGQPTQTFAASGRNVHQSLSQDADIVTGDATRAYAGQLTRALRTVVYLRPNLVLVHDQLASDVARRWEWNLHADRGMQGSGRSARVDVDGASVCVDLIAGPAVRFELTDRFPFPPQGSGRGIEFRDQQHGRFTAVEPSREAHIVVALRVGCEGRVPKATRSGHTWVVPVNDGGAARSVVLHGDRAELR